MRCYMSLVLLAWMVILLCEFNNAQNRLQRRGRNLRLRYVPVSSSAMRRLRLYRMYRRPSELNRVIRYRSRGRSPSVNVIRANSSPKRQIAKSTKVNKKKKITTNHIKQTIILAKTANIMSPVHGNQNNGPSSMINKGSGSIQSRGPQRGSSGSRGQRKPNKNTGMRQRHGNMGQGHGNMGHGHRNMGQGHGNMDQGHGGNFQSNNNGGNGHNGFNDHGRNERGHGNSLNDVRLGGNQLSDLNVVNAGMTGFGNLHGGHNNGIGHSGGHGNGNGNNMNDLNGLSGGTGFGNLQGHSNGIIENRDHGIGHGNGINDLSGLIGGVSGFGNSLGGQNGGQGHGDPQSQLNSLLQRINALNVLGQNGRHEPGNFKQDLLSQLLAVSSMKSLLDGSLPSASGAAELLNSGLSSDVLLGSMLAGNNIMNGVPNLSVLNPVSPPHSQTPQNLKIDSLSSNQNSQFSSLSPGLGITPSSQAQQPVIIKSNGGHLNIGLKKDPNTGKSNIVIQTAAAAMAREMMEVEPPEMP